MVWLEPEKEVIDWLGILKEGEPDPEPLGSESDLSDWSDSSTNDITRLDDVIKEAAESSLLGPRRLEFKVEASLFK